MNRQAALENDKHRISPNDYRSRLLAGIPAAERRIEPAGCPTALLEAGEGPPVILLHGPGESALWWMRVIPLLRETHRVIVPDLPGHGASGGAGEPLDEPYVVRWLDELIDETCASPPLLVGHLLGGSIAARYAIGHGDRIRRLALVNSFGLGKFRPAPGFALRLLRFMVWPNEKNYKRFLPQCIYDVEELREQMGRYWEPFLAYNLKCAENPDHKSAMKSLMQKVGTPKIPDDRLSQIETPTTLIWGRHDRANKLAIAERASERHGWPLHVIDEARDDPKLERPEAVVRALRQDPDRLEIGA